MSNLNSYNYYPINDGNTKTSHNIFEPNTRIEADQLLFNSIKSRILKNIKNNGTFLIFFQFIYINTYLISKTLEISPLINKNDHVNITNYGYAYDLTLIFFITYAMNTISFFNHIEKKLFENIEWNYYFKKRYIYLYTFLTIASSIVFALLGEVPFLRNFSISGEFWKHFTVKEVMVFLIIGIPIVFNTIKEIFFLIKNREFKRTFFIYLFIFTIFFYNYLILLSNGATQIHYHIHHAIFAGIMAVLSSDWKYITSFIMHAIYMGVLIEGISFYGVEEIYIFMTDETEKCNYTVSLIFSTISIIIFLNFIYVFYERLFFINN